MRRVKINKNTNDKTMPFKDVRVQQNLQNYWIDKRDAATNEDKKYIYDRNYFLIFLGFVTAFRCEDLIQLKPVDLDGGYVRIKENKTGKAQNFQLNKEIKNEIEDYVKRNEIAPHEYLFKSRRKDGVIRAITRQQAWRIIKEAGDAIGIKYKYGVHSLRKTFAYNYIKSGANLETLRRMLNHADQRTTLLYTMWDSEDVEQERRSIMPLGAVTTYRKREKIES